MYFTIKSITLTKFTGMWLNDTQYFHASLEKPMQLILGRNGSGKSRLISQLSPLAPNRSDFDEGGYKKLVVDNGKEYRLYCKRKGKGLECSIYNATDKHTVCNNVTPSVYNKFIEEIFGYTKDLHELLTGRIRLTTMRTPERRKWFSLLSESDLTYALSFYRKAREVHRDTSGSIKTLKRSIGELRPRVIENEKDFMVLEERIVLLERDITTINEQLNGIKLTPTVDENYLIRLENELISLSDKIVSLPITIPSHLKSLDVHQYELELAVITTKKNAALSQLQQTQDRLAKLTNARGVQYDNLKEESLKISSILEEPFETSFNFDYFNAEELTEVRHFCENNFGELIAKIRSITVCDKTPTERYRLVKDELVELTENYNSALNRLRTITASLINHQQTTEVECDNCNHKFKPGYSKVQVDQLRTSSKVLTEFTEATSKELERLQEQLEAIKIEVVAERFVSDMFSRFAHPILQANFRSYANGKTYHTDSLSVVTMLSKFKHDVVKATYRRRCVERQSVILHELSIMEAVRNEDVDAIKIQVTEMSRNISQLVEEEQLIISTINTLKKLTENQRILDELATKYDNQLEHYLSAVETDLVNIKYRTLTEHKEAIWDLLTIAKTRHRTMSQDIQQLRFQEQQLVELETRYQTLGSIVKTLSPEEGILAKHLYQCITKITDLMSSSIASIWGYDLRILPCEVTDGEMEYKFPFWAKDASKQIEDVSFGSKAQKEVIDFVFVLAVYRALGLEQYPLYLDEISSGFDDGHRHTLIEFVEELISKQHHSQCFMVSHDANTHFKLTHAETIVLDTDGIELPTTYNQNVIIE